MKVMKRIFFILAVCFMIGLTSSISISAEAIVMENASNNGMTVVAKLLSEKLNITISSIKIVEKDQMLTYSLVSEDAAEGILYANAVYVNGQTEMEESISISGKALTEESLNGCVLTVQNAAGEQMVSIRFALEPTATPTATPTAEPTATPTATPTAEPTATPTAEPTATPTAEPTATPAAEPTATPTAEPTATPTAEPTATPTAEPTATPIVEPTAEPTATPAPEDSPVPPSVEEEDDEEEVQPESAPAEEASQTTSTDTGDESKIGISICMLAVSLVVMLALMVIYSKNKVHGRTTEKED